MKLAWSLGLVLVAACGERAEGPRSMLDEAQAEAARAECRFGAGTEAGLSLAEDVPLGRELPIDHVLVLMMQGRSFDHLLAGLAGAESAADDAANLDASGQPIARHRLASYCLAEPAHDWNAQHLAWADGRNDGFVRASGMSDTMGFYDASDLPALRALAARFAVADHYHASVLGPPAPNRALLYAGSSFGQIREAPTDGEHATLFDSLEAAGVRWAAYSRVDPGAVVLPAEVRAHQDRFRPFRELVAAMMDGDLPEVAFIDPLFGTFGSAREDFGAPGDIHYGDDLLNNLLRALVRSPAWPRTVLFLTFADGGGMYDHAPPPAACAPDGIAPALGDGDRAGGFDRLGFRVPLIAISPWARPGFVGHATYDHTSLVRFIEARFHLPALSARDANARPPFELFDFATPHLSSLALPEPPLDPGPGRGCQSDDD
jgi:phospholipase C